MLNRTNVVVQKCGDAKSTWKGCKVLDKMHATDFCCLYADSKSYNINGLWHGFAIFDMLYPALVWKNMTDFADTKK